MDEASQQEEDIYIENTRKVEQRAKIEIDKVIEQEKQKAIEYAAKEKAAREAAQ